MGLAFALAVGLSALLGLAPRSAGTAVGSAASAIAPREGVPSFGHVFLIIGETPHTPT